MILIPKDFKKNVRRSFLEDLFHPLEEKTVFVSLWGKFSRFWATRD